MAAFHVCKAHLLLLTCKLTEGSAQAKAKECLDRYLAGLDGETVLRLARHDFLRADLKNRFLALHGLDAGITAKALALWSLVTSPLRRFRARCA
ncbi:MAG: hypothetical protein LBQ51_00945 [Desulfovibrio sp.]|jgi:hypothetical protein|nr:hypothetical protein [Desulfovibrio sp.]